MSNIDDSKRLIEELRAKRTSLGEGGKLNVPKVHYKRIRRPKLASIVLFCYTFGAGMLFSNAILTGYKAVWFCFIVMIGVIVYTYLKE